VDTNIGRPKRAFSFTQSGSLGISFGSDTPEQPPFITAIRKGSQAEGMPGLEVGMVLIAVNHQEISGTSFKDAIGMLKTDVRPGPGRPGPFR
jgi:hypothetical protein